MDTFGILFGSQARVKIMRLFLLNSESVFDNADISKRSKVSLPTVRTEIACLLKAGLIKKTSFFKEVPARTKKGKPTKKRVSGWRLDNSFTLLRPLRSFLINTEPMRKEEILNKFKHAGRLKLLVIAGTFIQNEDSRVDLLIVGDNIKKAVIENALLSIESEVGKEISYAYFDTQEFLYRVEICDKFVRDVFDYAHEKIINKLSF
ncbi:transcriptional regulator [Patescibacteria group bacterium]|nr:transcriptional regulator [Patescibacteria group bacterium]MBU1519750.1 transcriptional regulator [Patescibacteria group bacterium]MBU2416864.1 transcriptional regulator [Patescibacteria group bacterium]MBU2460669.1 transcriptional regulator [Patescibacteria group bacterium]